MASQHEKSKLDSKAGKGETVVPGGKTHFAQKQLAEGRSKGGQTRKEQLGTEGYQEMGRKGGLATHNKPGGEEEGVDESKFKTEI